MELKEIQQLIKLVSSSKVDVVELEQKDFKIKIKKNDGKTKLVSTVAQAPIAIAPQLAIDPVEAPTVKGSAIDESSNQGEIKSPMIGTFYRSASPDKPAFVSVGDVIEVGQVICIVEAMKLFNEIESEVSGKIVKVLVDDASPVEYDQPLFLIEPS